MALIWTDGFDNQAATVAGSRYALGGAGAFSYVTGRTGSGSALANLGSGTNSEVYLLSATPTLTAVTVGVAVRNGVVSASAAAGQHALVYLSMGGTTVVGLRLGTVGSGAPGVLTVNRGVYTAAGSVLGTSPVPLGTDATTWHYVEMRVVCSTGSGGSVTVRQDGVETLHLPGLNTGSATVNGCGLYAVSSGNRGVQFAFDDLYVADSGFLGDVRVLTLVPDGNGASSMLVGSDGNSVNNYQLVDEVPPSTADYVGGAAEGAIDRYTFSNLPVDGTVLGVQVNGYAAKSDAGAKSGKLIAYDGVTVVYGPAETLTTSYTQKSWVQENAPDGAPWTRAKVDLCQFGWEVNP